MTRELRSGVGSNVPTREARVLGVDWSKLTLIPGEQLSVQQHSSQWGFCHRASEHLARMEIVASESGGFDKVGSRDGSPDSLEVFYDSVDGLVPVQGEVENRPNSSGGGGVVTTGLDAGGPVGRRSA